MTLTHFHFFSNPGTVGDSPDRSNMKTASFLTTVLAAVPSAYAQVKGSPFGFAAGVTGGGDAEPVYPQSIDEFVPPPQRPWCSDVTDMTKQAHRVPYR